MHVRQPASGAALASQALHVQATSAYRSSVDIFGGVAGAVVRGLLLELISGRTAVAPRCCRRAFSPKSSGAAPSTDSGGDPSVPSARGGAARALQQHTHAPPRCARRTCEFDERERTARSSGIFNTCSTSTRVPVRPYRKHGVSVGAPAGQPEMFFYTCIECGV